MKNFNAIEEAEKIQKPSTKVRKPFYKRYKILETLLIAGISLSILNIGYKNKEEIKSKIKNTSYKVVEYFDLLRQERQIAKKQQQKIDELALAKTNYENKLEKLTDNLKKSEKSYEIKKEDFQKNKKVRRSNNLKKVIRKESYIEYKSNSSEKIFYRPFLNPDSEFWKNSPESYIPVIKIKRDKNDNLISKDKIYLLKEAARKIKSRETEFLYSKSGDIYSIDRVKYPEFYEIVDKNNDGYMDSVEESTSAYADLYNKIAKKYPKGDIESIVHEFVSKYSKKDSRDFQKQSNNLERTIRKENQAYQTKSNQQEKQKNYEMQKQSNKLEKSLKESKEITKNDSKNLNYYLNNEERYPRLYEMVDKNNDGFVSRDERMVFRIKFPPKGENYGRSYQEKEIESIVNKYYSQSKKDNSKIYNSLNPNSEFSKNTPKGYMPVIRERKDKKGNVISQKKEYISQEEAKNSKSHSYEQLVYYPKTGNEYWIDGDKYPEYFEIVDLNKDGKISLHEMSKSQGEFTKIIRKYPEGDIESIVREFVSKYSK